MKTEPVAPSKRWTVSAPLAKRGRRRSPAWIGVAASLSPIDIFRRPRSATRGFAGLLVIGRWTRPAAPALSWPPSQALERGLSISIYAGWRGLGVGFTAWATTTAARPRRRRRRLAPGEAGSVLSTLTWSHAAPFERWSRIDDVLLSHVLARSAARELRDGPAAASPDAGGLTARLRAACRQAMLHSDEPESASQRFSRGR